MAFDGVRCPVCTSHKIHRKRRSTVRYKEVLDSFGQCIGEYHYYEIQCFGCRTVFYLRERYLYQISSTRPQRQQVEEREFQHAYLFKLGKAFIGNTASEYTRKISKGIQKIYL